MNKYSVSFVKIASEFFSECQKIRQLPCNTVASLDGVLATLPHVIKTKGYVYEVLTSFSESFEYKNYCYARVEVSPNEKDYYMALDYLLDVDNPPLDMLQVLGFRGIQEEPEDVKKTRIEEAHSVLDKHKFPFQIEKKIKSEFCPESAWEWLLLSDLWMILTRDEDSDFHLCKYVFDWKECLSLAPGLLIYFSESWDVIPHFEDKIAERNLPKTFEHAPWCKYLPYGKHTGFPSKDSLRSAIEFLKSKPSLLPYADIVDENTIDIVYYAWCSWGGLIEYTYRASLRRWGKIKLEKIKERRVFDYYFKNGFCPFQDENTNFYSFKLRPIY